MKKPVSQALVLNCLKGLKAYSSSCVEFLDFMNISSYSGYVIIIESHSVTDLSLEPAFLRISKNTCKSQKEIFQLIVLHISPGSLEYMG